MLKMPVDVCTAFLLKEEGNYTPVLLQGILKAVRRG
jgi:hypothetical protein